jgi:hypothetical protein
MTTRDGFETLLTSGSECFHQISEKISKNFYIVLVKQSGNFGFGKPGFSDPVFLRIN